MKLKISLIIISLIILFVACKKTDTTDSTVPLQTNFTNVAYGNDPAQVMDIYLPPNRSTTNTNVLIMIHGGGWTGGDKIDFDSFIDTIQTRFPTYAIFNINYRLAAGVFNLFPTQENDVRSAVAFIYSKRADYKISDNYAIMGASAGGHLALLEAYKDTTPIRIKTVIDFFGPADMTAMYNNPSFPGGEVPIFNVMGNIPQLNSSLYEQSSPINFITPRVAPTIILHGGVDILVRHEQSDSLFAHLDSANVAAEYVFYPTQNHGWSNTDTLKHSFDHIQAFVNAHMP
ncbi:MAG: alpha/beta hydrolase [Ferruginibacter sp.]